VSGSRPLPARLAVLLLPLTVVVAGCQLVTGPKAEFTLEPGTGADEATLAEAARIIEGRMAAADVKGGSADVDGGAVVVRVPEGRLNGELTALLTVPGRLELRPVRERADAGETRRPFSAVECSSPIPVPPGTEGVVCVAGPGAADGDKLLVGPVAVDNVGIDKAEVVILEYDPNARAVVLTLDRAGGRAFAELTGRLACEPPGSPRREVAIVLDGVVINNPPVAEDVACGIGIVGGQVQVNALEELEATRLAALAANGPLPVVLRPRPVK